MVFILLTPPKLNPVGKLNITSLFIKDYPFWAKPFSISLAYISSKLEDLENLIQYDQMCLCIWKPYWWLWIQFSPELPHLYLAKKLWSITPELYGGSRRGSSFSCEESPWRFWTVPSHQKGSSLWWAPFPTCRKLPAPAIWFHTW